MFTADNQSFIKTDAKVLLVPFKYFIFGYPKITNNPFTALAYNSMILSKILSFLPILN